MYIIIFFSVLFIVLLTAPLMLAAVYYRRHPKEILYINQTRSKDPRHFGKSFAAIVKSGLNSASDPSITLSKEETFMDADSLTIYPEEADELVIARTKVFCPPSQVRKFQKEIYCENDAILQNYGLHLRAVYSKKRIILGDGISVSRWVDAGETLAIYRECNLGISASAGKRLSVGAGCRFRRLYAPEICVGQEPDATVEAEYGKNPRAYWLPCLNQKEHIRHGFSSDMTSDDGIVPFSIISSSDIIITDGLIIQGDLRSHAGIRLCDNVVVCGNIFAEGSIRIGRNSMVFGNVFSQENIWFEENAVVGRRGEIRSVIARENITFEKNTFVFGYVSCEREGRVLGAKETDKDVSRSYIFLAAPQELQHLEFENLRQYENIGSQGYRHKNALKDASLPQGAKAVPASFFFDCPRLTSVTFSPTIQEIGAYAFADCEELAQITGFGNMCVETIGTSAFENCRALSKIEFPDSVRVLGGAAFGGCKTLRSITFGSHSLLQSIGNHCFRGCESLEELYLPDMLSRVGVSAFKDCSGLKRVSVPFGCLEEPGIQELKAQGTELIFRGEEARNESQST